MITIRAASISDNRGPDSRGRIRRYSRCWPLLLLLAYGGPALAQDERLIDAEPYDVIVLNQANQGHVLRVFPLASEDRQLALEHRRGRVISPPTKAIRARRLDNADEEIDILWSGIERVELFEMRVLAEARQLTAQRKFDEAFEYLTFIKDRDPEAEGLEEAVDELLFTEASTLYREGKSERAVLLLDEVYQRDPARKGLVSALVRVLDTRFAALVKGQDYSAARRLHDWAAGKYPQDLSELLARWQAQLTAVAAKLLQAGQEDLAQGRLREAYLTSRRVQEVWPSLSGAKEFARQAGQRYPLLRVGVLQVSGNATPPLAALKFNWAQRRTERLLRRHLFELTRVGPDGGEYACVPGTGKLADDNRSLTVQLAPTDSPGLTAIDLAQMFLHQAASGTSWEGEVWHELVEQVSVPRLDTVQINLKQPHLRAQAALGLALDSWDVARIRSRFQPYRQPTVDGDAVRFVLNSDYAFAVATQPREVVEVYYESPQQALRALRQGEVDCVDRLFPAEIGPALRDPELRVIAYRVPSLHALVPNARRPHVGNRVFRRALAYAIDRNKILTRDLLAGQVVAGSQIISGPFSPGIGADDPMAYAYDTKIEPRAYDPRHARTLMQLAQIELTNVARKAEEPPPELKELVLAFPPHEIARIACDEIVADLKVLGLTCRLRRLSPGSYRPDDDDWDLLYLDYTLSEPLVEATELLASNGLAASPNPHLNLALRQLGHVVSWNEAGQRLRAVHQLCFDDTTVIPLWQLTDHLAIRRGIEGVAQQPMTPYDQIESWRLQDE